MHCAVIVVVVVLFVASVLPSMRWLLCGEKRDVMSMAVSTKNIWNRVQIYPAGDLSSLRFKLLHRQSHDRKKLQKKVYGVNKIETFTLHP